MDLSIVSFFYFFPPSESSSPPPAVVSIICDPLSELVLGYLSDPVLHIVPELVLLPLRLWSDDLWQHLFVPL